MNSQQYEELCRFFLAEKVGIGIDKIKSVNKRSPKHPDLSEYKHQIDFCWKTEIELSVYLNIANAKWRRTDKVDQPEVLLLHQVKEDINAHKAFMLTSQGYTSGAKAVAENKGIALHIVKPNFETANLPTKGSDTIQAKLLEMAASHGQPIFHYEVVHRAYDFSEASPGGSRPTAPPKAPGYHTRVVSGHETRVIPSQSNRAVTPSGSPGGNQTRGGGSINKGGGTIRRG